jgi:type I restriction enzyme S subunit
MFESKANLVPITDCIEIMDNLRKPMNDGERAAMQSGTLYPYYGAMGQAGLINDYLSDFDAICLAEDCGNYGAGEKSSYIIRGKAWVNNHAHLLKCKPNTNIEFLNECFRIMDLTPFINGTTRPKLTQAKLRTIKVPSPSLEIQKTFAAYSRSVDKLKFNLQQAIEKTKKMSSAILDDALKGEE